MRRGGTGALGSHMHKPEYETCCAFGPLLLERRPRYDFPVQRPVQPLRTRYDIGGFHRGLRAGMLRTRHLTARRTPEGCELRWGDKDAIVALLKLMIAREGIGDILADGVAKAAKRIGKGSEAFAVHAGGQEPGMHDGRLDPMMGLAFRRRPDARAGTPSAAAVYYNVSAPVGLRVLGAGGNEALRQGPRVRGERRGSLESRRPWPASSKCWTPPAAASSPSLPACSTGASSSCLNAVTGDTRTPDEWMEIGRRIQPAAPPSMRCIGLRPWAKSRAASRATPIHPRLAGHPPLERGPLKGKSVPLDAMVRNYRRSLKARIPTPASRSRPRRRYS